MIRPGTEKLKHLLAPLLLVLVMLLTAWAYWPGLNGPQLLDDAWNLKPLESVDFKQGFAVDVIIGNDSGPLGRPISMASFVLERLYFDHGVAGQKAFGMILHLVNGLLVYLLCRSLFGVAGAHKRWPALLTATLWLTAPLLLSTTLYVVQRMTMLSGLFTLLALWSYCLARERLLASRSGWMPFTLPVLFTLLAALCKENGLLALPMMTALELFLFDFRAPRDDQRRLLKRVHGLLIVGPLLLGLLLLLAFPDAWLSGYARREFTLVERLLTESRILFDYLRQLLWPDVHRLGVYQDDVHVSRSILNPVSTLAAIAAWIAIAIAVVASLYSKKFRLAALGITLFLVGQAMESTLFPLELYFEHRNYIPALGFWLALVALAYQLMRSYRFTAPWVVAALLLIAGRNWVLLSSQAVIWSDEQLVHMEAVNHHPDSQRALFELARVYALEGHLDEALVLVDRAAGPGRAPAITGSILYGIYHCLAEQPLPEDFLEGVSIDNHTLRQTIFSNYVYYLAEMVMRGKCSNADGVLFADRFESLLVRDGVTRGTPVVFRSMLLLENHLERYQRAMRYAELLLERDRDDVMGLQFKLYLAFVLDLPAAKNEAASRLQALLDAGELNREQVYNFRLFVKEGSQSPLTTTREE